MAQRRQKGCKETKKYGGKERTCRLEAKHEGKHKWWTGGKGTLEPVEWK